MVIVSLITSCDKEDNLIPLVSQIPSWVEVENGDLGQVVVTQLSENGGGKEDFQFEISANNEQINWEFYQNQKLIVEKDKWQGIFNSIETANKTIKIVFVAEPLESNLGETNMTYRYNMLWENSFSKEAVLTSYNEALGFINNSNVTELADVLQSVNIRLINDVNIPTIASASSAGIIMNTYRGGVSQSYYSTTWIHESAHIYEDTHPEIEKQMQVFFNDATWQEPLAYYATGRNEMWACALTSYITNNPTTGGSHHFVHREAYYQDVILPYLRELFE